MPFSRTVKSTLKAITRLEPDIKQSYKAVRRMDLMAARFRGLPMDYTIWDKEIKNGAYKVPVRVFEPMDEYTESMLLFFHGGGWVTGNIDTYSKVCANLAQATGHILVSVDYRLAPEYKFPNGLNDCYAVAEEVFTNGFLEIPPKNITLIGDSAGGNISAALSLMARDRGNFLPARQILIYPALNNDHSDTSPFESVHENGESFILTKRRITAYTDLYRSSEADLYNPYYAPLMSKDYSNQPDTLIITGEYDPLRDEGEEYGRRLSAAGNYAVVHRISDALHGYMSLSPRIPQVKETYDMINKFLNTV